MITAVPLEHPIVSTRTMYAGRGNKKAVIYLHGFASSPDKYFYPNDLVLERGNWDAIVVGYPTGYFSCAYPTLDAISRDLSETLAREDFQKYESIVFVGNSVGGVLALKALLQSPKLSARTKSLLLFGSPVGGVKYKECAFWQRMLQPILQFNPQIQDLEHTSASMRHLKTALVDKAPAAPYEVVAITGGYDSVVRSWSSEKPIEKFKLRRIDRLPHATHWQLFQVPIVVKQILRATKPQHAAVVAACAADAAIAGVEFARLSL